MVKKVALVALLVGLAGAASAKDKCHVEHFFGFPVEVCSPGDRDGGHDRRVVTAPEIDSGSAIEALTLALGALALLRARRPA